MLLTMKAPVSRDKGQRTVRCNESQANILRKVGWTEVETVETQHIPIVTTVAAHYLAEEGMGSPPEDQTLEPDPVTDPDGVRVLYERQGTAHDLDATGHESVGRDAKPKRKYHRRVVKVEPNGKVNYSIKPPKRRYRRRDMTAED
jgi:hypothetical protein